MTKCDFFIRFLLVCGRKIITVITELEASVLFRDQCVREIE